ncbi:MAG: transposase, partial [Candidatus Omnitrophota bacterium]
MPGKQAKKEKMPRLPRINIKGVLYYITCKSIHSQYIFKDGKDYEMFLELLKRYQEQYGMRLFSYVLLPGHLHLLLEMMGEGEQVSSFMHNLNNAYTKYFNGRYQRKGHLFRGRFKAAIVEKAPNLTKLTAYMHLNPKRLNLVPNAKDYPHSSYGDYLNLERGKQFTPLEAKEQQEKSKVPLTDFNFEQEIAETLGFLKDKGYMEFVDNLTREDAERLHKNLQRGGIFGSEEFIKKIKKEIADSQSGNPDHASERQPSHYRLFIFTGSFLL